MTDVVGTSSTEITSLTNTTLRLARQFRRHADPGLTPSQMSALSTLERRDGLRIGELAVREQIGKSSVTRLVANLELLGYVDRQPDPFDGRSFCVGITPQGRRLLARSNELASEYLEQRVAELSPEDRRLLLSALPAFERLTSTKR